jgi:two-component system phosphate regulon response regulator PhoB
MSGKSELQKVLLVDDDELIQDIYTTKFSEAGLNVDTAEDGESGLEMLREETYDAVMADVIMPGMDGLEFLEKLRNEELAKNASVIVLSNQGQPGDIDAAEKFDIDGYIIKASKVPSEVLEEITDIYNQSHA